MTSQSWNFGGARQSHHRIKYGYTSLINSSIYRYFKIYVRLENRILLTWLFEGWCWHKSSQTVISSNGRGQRKK